MLKLNKQKYYDILKDEGLSAALTQLHRDKEQMEFVTFEGEKGYQREYWDHLAEYRLLSRELWDIAYQNQPAKGTDPSRPLR
jgi:hypothetical protein